MKYDITKNNYILNDVILRTALDMSSWQQKLRVHVFAIYYYSAML